MPRQGYGRGLAVALVPAAQTTPLASLYIERPTAIG